MAKLKQLPTDILVTAEVAERVSTMYFTIQLLHSALSTTRGQWVHSVNKGQCLNALAYAEETKEYPHG